MNGHSLALYKLNFGKYLDCPISNSNNYNIDMGNLGIDIGS